MKKTIVLCSTALLVILIAIVFFTQAKIVIEASCPIRVTVHSQVDENEIQCWKNEKGEFYVFLPGYADLSQVQIYTNTDNPVSLDGESVTDGMNCANLQLDVPYKCAYSAWGKKHERTIIFVQSGGIPTMFVDTQSGRMDYIHNKKGNEEPGTISLYNADGVIDYVGDLESISGRGNNTWTSSAKKSYNLKLSSEADLLEMGNAQKWILLSNSSDPTNLRNKIAYDFAAEIGLQYSPDSTWVDLYLNGEYAGVYLLCERNEVHSERVDIAENESFLVSMELEDRLIEQNYIHVVTDAGQALRVHYPLKFSEESFGVLTEAWQSIENAILAEDGIDPVTGKSWLELIDLDSWVKKYLMEEGFGNLDGYFVSQFFYKDGQDNCGKVFAGPIWDFDKSMGNDSDPYWSITNPNVFVVNRFLTKNEPRMLWSTALCEKEEFRTRVVELFKELFLPKLEMLLEEQLQDYIDQIAVASKMNLIRWLDEAGTSNLDEKISQLSTYIQQHNEFLYSAWVDGVKYCRVSITNIENNTFYAVLPGECLSEIPQIEDTDTSIFCGLYYVDTNEPFDPARPIIEDVEIYARWKNASSNTLDRVIKLIPLGCIAVMFSIVFIVDVIRMKRERGTKNGRT